MVDFWKLAYEEVKEQRDQCKADNDLLIDDLVWHKTKVNRLERENEQLKESHIKHITNMENYYKDRLQKLKEENKTLCSPDVVFKLQKELQEAYIKAKAFDEVRNYVLNNHDEFEDRKDRARNSTEYDYFRTLQIANNAVINKCRQLEVGE